MLIKEIMHKNPITISPSTTLCDAYQLMSEKKIRHLPVVENGKLVGIVTDRDLRLATSRLAKRPFDPKDEVRGVMISPVITASPTEPVEAAAKTMRDLKIGSLPVVEGDEVVGIVTAVDLLDAMIMLTGVRRPSGRLDIRLSDRPGELARLSQMLAERKINIHSILSYPEDVGRTRVVLRVNTMEIRPLAADICSAGFEILWPLHISCVK